jgi:hypothetical protein
LQETVVGVGVEVGTVVAVAVGVSVSVGADVGVGVGIVVDVGVGVRTDEPALVPDKFPVQSMEPSRQCPANELQSFEMFSLKSAEFVVLSEAVTDQTPVSVYPDTVPVTRPMLFARVAVTVLPVCTNVITPQSVFHVPLQLQEAGAAVDVDVGIAVCVTVGVSVGFDPPPELQAKTDTNRTLSSSVATILETFKSILLSLALLRGQKPFMNAILRWRIR